MPNQITYEDNQIAKFHIPRWDEIPKIDLYADQLVNILEQYLSNYIKNDENIITKTMINNYVKQKVINPPINKRYNTEHVAYLFVICVLKQVFSITDISELIKFAIKTVPIEKAYDEFCNELEKAINLTFVGKEYGDTEIVSKERYILRNVVQAFANQLYVKRVYLKK